MLDDVHVLRDERVAPILVAPDAPAARNVVRRLNRSANIALKLSGSDAAILPQAGCEIGRVHTPLLDTLLDAGYVPVIAPTAFAVFAERDPQLVADDVASAIASAVGAERALFFHPQGGIIDGDELIESLTAAEALALADRADIAGDVAALLRAAARGVRGGVGAARVLDGALAHAALIDLMTHARTGTTITGGVLFAA